MVKADANSYDSLRNKVSGLLAISGVDYWGVLNTEKDRFEFFLQNGKKSILAMSISHRKNTLEGHAAIGDIPAQTLRRIRIIACLNNFSITGFNGA